MTKGIWISQSHVYQMMKYLGVAIEDSGAQYSNCVQQVTLKNLWVASSQASSHY